MISDEIRATAMKSLCLFAVDKQIGLSLLLWNITLGQVIEMNPYVEEALYTGLTTIMDIRFISIVVPILFWLGVTISIHKIPRWLSPDMNITTILLKEYEAV